MILKPNEICKNLTCPYQKDPSHLGYCQGLNPERKNEFVCNMNNNGSINEKVYRSPYDKTGKCVLLEE